MCPDERFSSFSQIIVHSTPENVYHMTVCVHCACASRFKQEVDCFFFIEQVSSATLSLNVKFKESC